MLFYFFRKVEKLISYFRVDVLFVLDYYNLGCILVMGVLLVFCFAFIVCSV